MAVLTLEFDETNQSQFGPCECCGNMTSKAWGYVFRDDYPSAVYYVEWTPGHADSDASFDLILGKWGEATQASDRKSVSLRYRVVETGPSFMVIDSATRPIASSRLISHSLSREEVIGSPIATEVFELSDVIYLQDPRISELRR